MPASCCIIDCTQRRVKGSNVRFYRVPGDSIQRSKWVHCIRRTNNFSWEHARVCSKHFVSGAVSKDPENVDYVPNQHLGYTRKEGKPRPPRLLGDWCEQHIIRRSYQPAHRNHPELPSNQPELLPSNQPELLPSNQPELLPSNQPELLPSDQPEPFAAIDVPESEEETGVAVQTDPIIRSYLCHQATQTDLTGDTLVSSFNELSSSGQVLGEKKQEILQLKNQQALLMKKLADVEAKLEETKEELNAMNEIHEEQIRQLSEAQKQVDSLLSRSLNASAIEGDDTMTKFYTGLPSFKAFQTLLEHLKPHVKVAARNSKLSASDELLLCLTKLRLNLLTEDLAYRFDVHVSTVSRKFHMWLNALYTQVGGLVMWPTEDYVQLPEAFQNEYLGKTKVIIDCFEIFIERPSALKPRAQTYSRYKKHNTAKALMGISPSGAVIFVSQAWGGRASDRMITLESGIIDKLNPGDVVLADRGFTMKEDFDLVKAKLLVPAFKKTKTSQLSAKEVEDSRMLASVRIHVERLIGRCKDYRAVKGPLPITFVKKRRDVALSTLDKILTVCSALTNLSNSVVM